jgi:hypothetical protein
MQRSRALVICTGFLRLSSAVYVMEQPIIIHKREKSNWSFKIKLRPLLTLNILLRLGKGGKSVCLLCLFFLLYFLNLASLSSAESHFYQLCEHLLFRGRVITSKIISS